MDSVLAREVLDCLASERRVFPYFKHRYALILLGLAAGRGRSVEELRRTQLASLLRKPVLGSILHGDELSEASLAALWLERPQTYVLTLDLWGDPRTGKRRWRQITRRGVNLVLQVNFSAAHERAFRRLVHPGDERPFEWSCHPVQTSGRRTLAWVRLDLDLDEGEALVEEIQSDWVRVALGRYRELCAYRSAQGTCRSHWWMRDTKRRFRDFERYVREVLEPHRRIWDEAALAAAIEFLARDVGIREIYLHTWEGGRMLKAMERDHPPVSLYEKLPQRFCFERVRRAPRFLRNEPGHRFRRRLKEATERHGFWYLRPTA